MIPVKHFDKQAAIDNADALRADNGGDYIVIWCNMSGAYYVDECGTMIRNFETVVYNTCKD